MASNGIIHEYGTKKSNAPSSEAKRNAEALFESKTIAEIREVELKTRNEIEHKKKQLRQLVGDSYRDLLESADKIVGISNNCQLILSNVVTIQEGFSSLAHNFSSADHMLHAKRESLSERAELYAVGGRIQYLVDTPEVIWGCLDSHNYLAAAKRYLRAEKVHNQLPLSFSPELLAKFPLVSHQWPHVQKFKQQVLDAALNALSTEIIGSKAAAVDAVAAVALLASLDTASALDRFLAARRAGIKGALDSRTGCVEDEAAVTALLSTLVTSIQLTVAQVGELFLPPSNSREGWCALQLSLMEDEVDAGELLFGGAASSGVTGGAGGPGAPSPEADAWRTMNKVIVESLSCLPPGSVERTTMSWIREVADDCSAHLPSLLPVLTTPASLMAVEEGVRKAAAAWNHPSREGAGATGARGLSKGMRESTAQARADQLGITSSSALSDASNAAREPRLQSWDAVCQWVVGRELSVWREVLYVPFLGRAKQLVEEACSAVCRSLESPLAAALEAAQKSIAEPAGTVSAQRWPACSSIAVAGVSGSSSTSSKEPLWSEKISLNRRAGTKDSADDDHAFRRSITSMRQQFDTALRAVLEGAVLLTSSGDPTPSVSRQVSYQGHENIRTSLSLMWRDAGGRAAELEPFVQQQVSDVASSLALGLAERLDVLGRPPDGVDGAAHVDNVLLIARLSHELASESRYLPILLGPPEGWSSYVAGAGMHSSARSGSSARLSSTRPILASSRLATVTDKFRSTSAEGHRIWARWASQCLVSDLCEALVCDDVLALPSTPPSWREVLVPALPGEADSLDEGLGDMRFHLPSCPSGATSSLLMAACHELRRAGDTQLVTEALQVFCWELSGAVLFALPVLLAPSGTLGARLSDKGVMQMLFDVRLLRDVLAGGRPSGASRASATGSSMSSSGLPKPLAAPVDSAVASSLLERKREAAALEQQLQERLDPIDWATYEPHLWPHVARYYARVSVLFGSLVQMQRTHPDEVARVGSVAAETNPLNVLSVAPRFHYLPISAPAATAVAAAQANNVTGITGSTLGLRRARKMSTRAKAFSVEMPSDTAAIFSFANLGSVTVGEAASPAKRETAAAAPMPSATPAGAATSTFSALHARLQGGALGGIGSIFSDKAAEVTAMAQQRFENFGDYLPTGSLLSTITKGVGSGVGRR